jgi:hypothetical protein
MEFSFCGEVSTDIGWESVGHVCSAGDMIVYFDMYKEKNDTLRIVREMEH